MVATDVAGDNVEALAAEIGGIAFRSDLGEPRDATALIAHVEQRVGPIDLVCWNPGAGESGGLELPDAAWQSELHGSVLTCLGLMRLVVPDMIRRGQGCIVSLAAWDAWRALPSVPATVAVSDDAVAALIRWLGTAYGARGLRTIALTPTDPELRGALAGHQADRQVDPDGVAALLLARLERTTEAGDGHSRTSTESRPS